MLENTKIEDIVFLDIETVPTVQAFDSMDQRMQALWDKKSKQFREPGQTAGDVFQRAGIYAEFGKIICISVGIIRSTDPLTLRLKSFFGDDETRVLSDFSSMIVKFGKSHHDAVLCAHNGKEFDFPYMARRMVINSLPIPAIIDNSGKKPWEIKLLDTMDLWKFGDYKSYTSLELLTSVLGIPTPKDDIDGSMVSKVFYEERDVERIARYCEKDVIAIAQVMMRFMRLPLIEPERIESVTFG